MKSVHRYAMRYLNFGGNLFKSYKYLNSYYFFQSVSVDTILAYLMLPEILRKLIGIISKVKSSLLHVRCNDKIQDSNLPKG